MGCTHRKGEEIIRWVVPRSQKPPQIVQEDTYILYRCPKCLAVRTDTQNEFVYGKGRYLGTSFMAQDRRRGGRG